MPKPINAKPKPLPVLDLVQGRACGACTACCQWVAIPEASDTKVITHARGDPCPRLSPGGCTAYGARPKVCVDFSCLWLTGFGGDEDRPDRMGVMFHLASDEHGKPFVAANEITDGALAPGTPGAAAVKEMGFQVLVVSVSKDGERRTAVMPMAQAQAEGLMDPAVAEAKGMALAKG